MLMMLAASCSGYDGGSGWATEQRRPPLVNPAKARLSATCHQQPCSPASTQRFGMGSNFVRWMSGSKSPEQSHQFPMPGLGRRWIMTGKRIESALKPWSGFGNHWEFLGDVFGIQSSCTTEDALERSPGLP